MGFPPHLICYIVHISLSKSSKPLKSLSFHSMASSSQYKRMKKVARRSRAPTLEGWISDYEEQTNFVNLWRTRKIIPHKYISTRFFRREGFSFQNWLNNQGLNTFVELTGEWYPDLVRVFYSNLKISDGTLCSRVKGIDIKLTEEVWESIAGFRAGGEKTHLGIEGLHKFSVYQDCLRDPNQARDCSFYKTGGMKRDDRLCAYVISWILLPRGSNHAQLTTEDIFIIYALKSNIQTDCCYLRKHD